MTSSQVFRRLKVEFPVFSSQNGTISKTVSTVVINKRSANKSRREDTIKNIAGFLEER
jgi:hypothetical protein